MKNKFLIQWGFGGALSLGLLFTQITLGQTNLQFTGVFQTDETAIRLTWKSTNSEVYQIQCADALAGNVDGSTAWQTIYDDYPSQGTNTFWLDTGNYNFAPQILHPKNMPMRFYRIVDKGADTSSDKPKVSIISPTNNSAASGELTVSVIASTAMPILSGTKLYVDGQEMRAASSATNCTVGSTNYESDIYNINTCEWGNKTHILFATAECESGDGSAVNSPPVTTSHAVSKFASVLFSNLVTRISFSEPSFDPSSGQTQQVSAVFANNCNWTLTVRDAFSNAVRTVTGSGSSLLYDWDGTGTGNTNLPTGIYYYYISAQTNGQSFMSLVSGGSISSSVSTASLAAESATQLWALPPDSSAPPLPLALYPPGSNTNGFTIFEASRSEVRALVKQIMPVNNTAKKTKSATLTASASSNGSSPQPAGAGGGSSANSQTTPPAPQRTPINPIVGISGTFGVAYDTYSANGTNGFHVGPLDNGLNIHHNIAMETYSGGTSLGYAPLPPFAVQANNFATEMQLYGWKSSFLKHDDQFSINDLRGSGTMFNQVQVGVLMLHGTYGSSLDYAANGCYQMYYPVTSGGSAQYLRLSEMDLGDSDPTNGLKWMVILACNSLQHDNWDDMQSQGIMPYNGNLHLLLGTASVNSTSSVLLQYWARYMNYGRGSLSPMTMRAAWYQAARDAYSGKSFTNTVTFAVAGDSACIDDYIEAGFNSSPQGSWTYDSSQVWP